MSRAVRRPRRLRQGQPSRAFKHYRCSDRNHDTCQLRQYGADPCCSVTGDGVTSHDDV